MERANALCDSFDVFFRILMGKRTETLNKNLYAIAFWGIFPNFGPRICQLVLVTY